MWDVLNVWWFLLCNWSCLSVAGAFSLLKFYNSEHIFSEVFTVDMFTTQFLISKFMNKASKRLHRLEPSCFFNIFSFVCKDNIYKHPEIFQQRSFFTDKVGLFCTEYMNNTVTINTTLTRVTDVSCSKVLMKTFMYVNVHRHLICLHHLWTRFYTWLSKFHPNLLRLVENMWYGLPILNHLVPI